MVSAKHFLLAPEVPGYRCCKKLTVEGKHDITEFKR
jgi:hypothetical protein